MSVPHTGKLTATVSGETYQFNGDDWTGPAGVVLEQLKAATAIAPNQHFDIRSLAENIFLRAGLAGNITAWKPDEWSEDIDSDAID